MKRMHMILLIITIVVALFSAYSLFAINQVYKINFQWYSQFQNSFLEDFRETSKDSWSLHSYPKAMEMGIIHDNISLKELKDKKIIKELGIPEVNLDQYVLIYCTLGEVQVPEYRVKFIDIVQRGNVVEIKLSINSPEKPETIKETAVHSYNTGDVIRIDRDAFPSRGKLYFIFKNQSGSVIVQKYCVL